MAFDQSSIPKDLRPLNIVRNVIEDTRIGPLPSSGRVIEGFYASPPADIGGSPGGMPAVYYPDPGFVPLGFNSAIPGVTGWGLQPVIAPQPVVLGGGVVSSSSGGYSSSLQCGVRVGTPASSDQASEEEGGCDLGLGTGTKLKFLCSFGGKILPRPSDGALRYVGGQTRIISFRKDVTFVEFLRKMEDIYLPNVVIKYQLPDEDLDALVSVSCGDDLENMMDEYRRLVEVSPEGSAKLRIFLFLPSELESVSLMHIGDGQDCGQRYVDAVNGVTDGFSSAICIARKESIESTVSVQNSDMSGNEVAEVSAEATSLPMPSNILPKFTSDAKPRVSSGDPSSSSPPIVAATKLGPVSDQLTEMPLPSTSSQAVPAESVPVPSPAMPQPFLDSYRGSIACSNYVPVPSQIGYPAQVLMPVFAQPSIPPGASSQQLSPPVHMTMDPSFMSMKVGSVPAFVQPQPVPIEHYPRESMLMHRVAQLPPLYNHVQRQEQVMVADPQQGLYTEKIPRFKDCYMCQKALPHAHSDTVAENAGLSSNAVDLRSGYHSLCIDDQVRPVIRMPNNEESESGNVQALASGIMAPVAVQFPCGTFAVNSTLPDQAFQAPVLPSQIQTSKDAIISRPLDMTSVAISQQARDSTFRESPKEYPVNATGLNLMDDSASVMDQLIQIDGRLENLLSRPAEVCDPIKEEILECKPKQIAAMEIPCTGNSVFPGVGPALVAERIPPSTSEWKDSTGWSKPRVVSSVPDSVGHVGSSLLPSFGVGDAPESSELQFVDQDLWNMKPEMPFPPPKPCKIQIRRETSGQKDNPIDARLPNSGEVAVVNCTSNLMETPLDFAALNQDQCSPNKEEQIQELQAVVDGVAATILNSSSPVSDAVVHIKSAAVTTSQQQNGDTKPFNVEMQHRDRYEEIKTKTPEKMNFGFPASGIGRLQIIKNSDLEELRELGSGTFGTVFHGKWRGSDVAIKRINDRCFSGKPSEQDRMRDDFWNEAIKLADLHHPNVVAFYGVVLDGPDDSVATVTEYMVNGSLRNALQRNERILDKRKRLLIAMDVAFGMEYLHGKNIVHFDLKSDNLLVNLRDPHRPICKVGDLGLSKVKCQTLISGGVRGTLPWMAPELLNGSSSLVSEKVDVFSYGIVMWELLTSNEPYADLHYGAIIGGIVSNTLRPPVPESCDSDWRALMERCWSSEPLERPNFTEIADELRAMAAKLPTKGQAQGQPQAQAQQQANPQAKS